MFPMEISGRKEAASLQRFTGILGTIAAVSPLLGLLGTVFGMISTFHTIAADGLGNAPLLAGGISEALITTATGLTIAIPSLVFFRYFRHQTAELVREMEEYSLEVAEKLNSITNPPQKMSAIKVATQESR